MYFVFAYVIKMRKNKSLIISFIPLFILLMLRDITVGNDTIQYINYFNMFGNMNINQLFLLNFEKGFVFLCKILYFVTSNQLIFLSCMSFFSLLGVYFFINKYSKMPWFSIWLFICLGFYGSCFNILRQVIAMNFLLMSIKYLSEKKFQSFILFVLLASLFHKTALIFILLYPISRFEINKLYFTSLVFFATLFYFFSDFLTNLFLQDIFSKYQNSDIESGGGLFFIMLISINVFCYLFGKNNIKRNKVNKIHFQMLNISLLLQMLAFSLPLATRLTSYFFISSIVLIPNVIAYQSKKNKVYLTIIIQIFTFAFFLYKMTIGEISGIVPYLFGK